VKICICGWFLLPKLLAQLESVNKKHSVFIVSHNQDNKKLKSSGLDYVIIPNIGLEFGAYDHYLKNVWTPGEDVLFMHDDVVIHDISFFDDISECIYDQGYVFMSEFEAKSNQNMHGRGLFCSSEFLQLTLAEQCTKCGQVKDRYDTHNPDTVQFGCGPHRGFWYDIRNLGHSRGKPPAGIRHYNDGIYHFESHVNRWDNVKYRDKMIQSGRTIINNKFDAGRRGEWLHRKREEQENAKSK